jgi:hypothetical protein
MPHRLYRAVAARAAHRCEYCLAPEAISPGEFNVEHVWPRRRRGSDDLSNLALACGPCNRRKSSATHGIDPDSDMSVPLFNPRRDDWDEHFEFSLKTGDIVGRTPTGRATVARLAMNHSHAVDARLLWVLIGWYPPE